MQEFLDKIENIRFVDVDELFVKKKYIREMYSEKEQSVKEIYKWYFYFQLCMLRNPLKSLFWGYINGENNLDELNFAYINFCNKRDGISVTSN